MHEKGVCKDFEIKNIGEYHDLYSKSDALLLAVIFENFRKMCLKIDWYAKANNKYMKYYDKNKES